jgi:hypothetical protein
MQRGRSILLTVLAGVLALVAGAIRPAHAGPPTAPFQNKDIGGPTAGKTDVTGGGPAAVWKVTGHGNDVWGASDQFQFAYTPLPGNGSVTARLLAQEGGHDDGWAKTGTMLRETDADDSRMAYMPYCNGNDDGSAPDGDNNRSGRNIEPGFRIEAAATPERAPGNVYANHNLDSHCYYRRLAGGPIWLRTQRVGQTYTHLVSDDGAHWQVISQDTIAIDPTKPLLAGVFACAHGDDQTVTATFDNVSVSSDVSVIGPANVQALPGTGAVLLTYGGTPNAVGYNIYRIGPTDKAPVKVSGDDPVPYTWFIDQKDLQNGTAYRYLVVGVLKDASGNASETAASMMVVAEPQVPIVPGWYSYDIGTETPGSTKVANGVLTLSGSGSDINNQADGFRYLATSVAGNYTLTAKLLEKPAGGPGNVNSWIKAGVMIRESLDASSRMANMWACPGHGVRFEARRGYRMSGADPVGDANAFVGDSGTDESATTYPQWLRLTRLGNTITGFQSTDGTTFTKVADTATYNNLSQLTFAGIAVTALNDRLQGIGKFDAASITIQ